MAQRRLSGTEDLIAQYGRDGATIANDPQKIAAALKLPVIYLQGKGRSAKSFTRIFSAGLINAAMTQCGETVENTWGTAAGAATL